MILQPKGSYVNDTRQTKMPFIDEDDTIIFSSECDDSIDSNLISHYKKVIFNNYEFDEYSVDKNKNKANFKNLVDTYNKFCYPLDNLPNTITHLTFSAYFNRSVDNLPNTLTHLTFGTYFNQPVDNLPNTLTHLTFRHNFNQSVDNLPNTLTHLTFGHNFNQPVDNLPNTLTHLTFGQTFNKRVDLQFNIKYLKLNCNNQYLIDNLHDGLEELEFN